MRPGSRSIAGRPAASREPARHPAHGPTLADLLARGPLEPARALELLDQLAQALDASHARGIIHPGVEPASVLIDEARGGRAVVDFSAEGATARSEPARAPGTAHLQYVSPERLLGQNRSPRSDVYSLAALLHHCLTGMVPFPRGPGLAAVFWHLHAPRPRPTLVRPGLPEAIDRVIARGMAIDPAVRPPTAGALIEAARAAFGADLAAEGAAAAPPRRSAGTPTRRRRAALMPLALLIALAVTAAGIGFVVASGLDDPPRSSLASAGRLQLTAPADWLRTAEPAPPSSLGLTDALVLAPPQSPETRLIAGTAGPAPIVALLTRLEASPPAGDLVSLARVQARRYRARALPGAGGPLTLYIAPMDHGVATLACLADSAPAAGSFMRRCARVAASVRLADGRFVPVGPSARQARGQARVFRRLNAARSNYRSRLEHSRTAAGLAAAARTLAFAHDREARALRSLELTGVARPGGRTAVRALERAAAAYRSLGAAAEGGDRGGYAAARRSALVADVGIRRALRMLRVVGYGA